MEFKLKTISKAGIPEAISKAELYRSLNEPEEAESICRDILAVEPDHQLALRLLGLAITDQFSGEAADRHGEAKQLFQRLAEPYERLYYTGLLHERRAKAQMRVGRSPHTRRFVPQTTTMLFFAGTGAPACCKVILAFRKKKSPKPSTPSIAHQSEATCLNLV